MNPRPLLRLEGAAVLIVSLFSYRWSQGSWLPFALLFLVPDLSMLGYRQGSRWSDHIQCHPHLRGTIGVGWLLVRVESPCDFFAVSHMDRSHRS
jgi:hypothetical protein